MAAYEINFSDPLKAGFSIPPGGFNGPTAGGIVTVDSSTTLRLYGRGAVEWGEAVDEDLVRLTENFASATPPSCAISGQLWAESTLYYHDSTKSNTNGWWFYDVNETSGTKWKLVNNTGSVLNYEPDSSSAIAVGTYYWDSASSQLRGYYSLGQYEKLAWITRSYFSGSDTNPNTNSLKPTQYLRLFDGTKNEWTYTTSPFSGSAAPTVKTVGQLWYNTTTGVLSVWNKTVWQQLLGPTLVPGNGTVSSGMINMSTNKITNLGAPVAGTDAATKAYADAVGAAAVSGIGAAIGAAPYLPITGGTLAGPGNLVVGGTQVGHKSLHSLNVDPSLRAVSRRFGQISVTLPKELNSYSAFGMEKAQYVGTPYTGGYAIGIDDVNNWFVAPTASKTYDGYEPGAVSANEWHRIPTADVALSVTTSGNVAVKKRLDVTGSTHVYAGIDAHNTKITNLATPTNVADATTKQYVDTAIASASSILTPEDVVLINPVVPPKDGDIRIVAPDTIEIRAFGLWTPFAKVGGGLYNPHPSLTGPATLNKANNTITMTGIVAALGLERGDVIEVIQAPAPTASGSRVLTVDFIDSANVIVTNAAHKNGAGTLSLNNTSVPNTTVRLVSKWHSAASGLGQAWIDVTSQILDNVNRVNTAGREIQTSLMGGNMGSVISRLYIDDIIAGKWGGFEPDECSFTFTIDRGGSYRVVNIPAYYDPNPPVGILFYVLEKR